MNFIYIQFFCHICHLSTSQIYMYFSKNGKQQKRGKLNLIGRLQLSSDRAKEEDNEGILQLRILRVQVSITEYHLLLSYTTLL